jgi:hypothetical protein
VRLAVVAWPAVNTKTKNLRSAANHPCLTARDPPQFPAHGQFLFSFPTRVPNGSMWVLRMIDGWRWAGGRSWWSGMSAVITLNAD